MRRREFRRMLGLSLACHSALLVVLWLRPSYPVASMPGVVSVELVSAPALAGPPRAAARPKPVPKKVVLPAEPTTPKPEPKPEPKRVAEKVPPPKPEPVEQDYSDVLEQLRADAGESAEPAPPTAEAAPAPAGSGSGVGQPVSPEVAAWMKKAKIQVRGKWPLPAAFRTQALEAHVLVTLDAAGNVIGVPEIVRRSGNPWYDDGVVRAIQKASPLPPPPAADEWAFVFVPGDSY
jgi:protein TonB